MIAYSSLLTTQVDTGRRPYTEEQLKLVGAAHYSLVQIRSLFRGLELEQKLLGESNVESLLLYCVINQECCLMVKGPQDLQNTLYVCIPLNAKLQDEYRCALAALRK